MTSADRLLIEPGDRVLDVCAAPGEGNRAWCEITGEGVPMASNDISNSTVINLPVKKH